jgi:hypothetical protein
MVNINSSYRGDYRQVFGLLELLTTYKSCYKQLQHDHYSYTLQFTVTHTSILSLLQSPVAVSWQRILTQELEQSH